MLKLLHVHGLIGLKLGIAVGRWWPEFGAALKPRGDGFVKLVQMMVASIAFCTIVSGMHGSKLWQLLRYIGEELPSCLEPHRASRYYRVCS